MYNFSQPFYYLLLFRKQLTQHRIVLDSFQLLDNNLARLGFDSFIVLLHDLFHTIGSVLVREVGDKRYLLVFGRFGFDFGAVHDDFGMENLLVDPFVEIIRHGSDEHALRERRNLRLRNETVHLCRYGGGGIVAVDGHRLPLLQNLSEAFG